MSVKMETSKSENENSLSKNDLPSEIFKFL